MEKLVVHNIPTYLAYVVNCYTVLSIGYGYVGLSKWADIGSATAAGCRLRLQLCDGCEIETSVACRSRGGRCCQVPKYLHYLPTLLLQSADESKSAVSESEIKQQVVQVTSSSAAAASEVN